jgi:hypothetical protein
MVPIRTLPDVKRCRILAQDHATAPFQPNHREPNTISHWHQKSAAQEEALVAWQARWHNSPRSSDAYTALPTPPSPLVPFPLSSQVLQAAHAPPRPLSSASQKVTSLHPTRQTHCPYCASNPQTVAHIIKHCPHFAAARATNLRPAARDLLPLSSAPRKEEPHLSNSWKGPQRRNV